VTSVDIKATERFIAGGTLHLDAPSYVTRLADDELFEQVLAGQFCYILTPRQMGKSSLMIRAAERLRRRGFRTAIVDLSWLGTMATSEQWYLGIIKFLAQDLRLAVEPRQWWGERGAISPVQRFTIFLHDVVLAETAEPIVVFIDEIDSTLKLPFADDFFAAIRHTYNQRARDPAYDHLTFVLLGVVAPTDLIKDRNRTPFNIGRAIDLHEFSRADAGPLEEGLERLHPDQGRHILDRVFHWTGGHPYLTQKLCREIAETSAREWTDAEVDQMVVALFLSDEAQKERNLQFVNNYVEASPERRQLVRLYGRIYAGEAVQEDERSPTQNRLKLIGLVRAEGGTLHVRNEIYREVFNVTWIKRNTPANALQIVTWAAVIVIIATIAIALLFAYRRSQETIALGKELYLDAISTREVGAQLYHLGQLCDLSQGEARSIFFDHTDHQQQVTLFVTATYTTTTSKQLAAVFDCLYQEIDSRVHDPQDRVELSSAMCRALQRLDATYGDEGRQRLCAAGQ